VGEFIYLVTDIAWLFLQRIPSNVWSYFLLLNSGLSYFGTMHVFMHMLSSKIENAH
jgi:hypothetical protein